MKFTYLRTILFALLIANMGGSLYATEDCAADAGILIPISQTADGEHVDLLAEFSEEAEVDTGFVLAFVLTRSHDLIIEALGGEPSFTVDKSATYRIHSLVIPDTLDLSGIELGKTTASEVVHLLEADSVCFDLFVEGAVFDVEICTADAGTLESDSQNDIDRAVRISAKVDHIATVPDGFILRYVLTQTDDLIIEDLSEEPTFVITEDGRYRIHSLVVPEDFDFSVVSFGTTKAADVLDLIADNDICAALFVEGALFDVDVCEADEGRLSAGSTEINEKEQTATITANVDVAPTAPEGFILRYVLTFTDHRTIVQLGDKPMFTVDEDGRYRIHSLVVPEDFDFSVVEIGETTGDEVNNLILSSGICAEIFLTGAVFDVRICTADEGRLSAGEVEVNSIEQTATITADIDVAPTVPEGFILRYVLTQTNDLIIVDLSEEPTFTVEEDGRYRIHSVVVAEDFDFTIIEIGETTGFEVNDLFLSTGICAEIFLTGAIFDVITCLADEGRLSAGEVEVDNIEQIATFSADVDVDPTVPEGFILRYVLTQTDDLIIVDLSEEPTFTVDEEDRYRIHSIVVLEDFDFSIIEIGETTGFEVNDLFLNADFCAEIFLTGAIFDIVTCEADAGTLEAASVEQVEGGAILTAEVDHEATVPDGFDLLYVLTTTDELIILETGEAPEFTITEDGQYRIHSLVVPEDLDLGIIEPGETTAETVLGVLEDNEICSDLLVDGAFFQVIICGADAGTLAADTTVVDTAAGTFTLIAEIVEEAAVPDGFSLAYVLTSSNDLVIEEIGAETNFTVSEGGRYRIHSFVFVDTLDLSVIEIGVTTGFDVLELIPDDEICADLLVDGALFDVGTPPCDAFAGTLAVESEEVFTDRVEITAAADIEAVVPEGFVLLYVLTNTDSLVIIEVGEEPSFELTGNGRFRIHSLVVPDTLDLSVVELGSTTGFDVVNLLTSGNICFDLDVEGAIFDLEGVCAIDEGRLSTGSIEEVEGGVQLTADIEVEPTVAIGFILRYVLTETDERIIIDLGEEPTFVVEESGRYRIHSLVVAEDFDFSIVELGETKGFEVNDLILSTGLCAEIFLTGAVFDVTVSNNAQSSIVSKLSGVEMKVYPNPSQDVVHLQPSQALSGSYMIQLLNSQSTEVYSKRVPKVEGRMDLDVSAFSAGIYYLIVTNFEGDRWVEKVMIAH